MQVGGDLKPVLLCWELGDNLGHVMPLAAMARQFLEKGWPVVLAARDLYLARIAFAGMPVRILQAPRWPSFRHQGTHQGQGNYTDILAQIGFAEPDLLEAVVSGWIGLIDLVAPAALVCDHSPALHLAAKIRQKPVVAVGTPFLMPPLNGDRLPSINAFRSEMLPEDRIMSSVEHVMRGHKKPAPQSLPELLRTDFRFVFGLPEIDPWLDTRREALYSPVEPLPAFSMQKPSPEIYIYHGGEDANAETLFQAALETGIQIKTYVRGKNRTLMRFLERRGVECHDTPPPLTEVLPSVTHVITAAGAQTTQAAMAAGRPQMLLPRHNEAELNTTLAVGKGVAVRQPPYDSLPQIREAIIRFVEDQAMGIRAVNLGKIISQRQQQNGMPTLLAVISRFL